MYVFFCMSAYFIKRPTAVFHSPCNLGSIKRCISGQQEELQDAMKSDLQYIHRQLYLCLEGI